jgi:rRNA processing protein Gar1
MTREEKIKLAIEKGFTYDEVNGKVYGIKGKEIIGKTTSGYIVIKVRDDDNKTYFIRGHQFAYYYKYNKIVDCIDHKDGNKLNNKIDNLREVTRQQNQHNRPTAKGYIKIKEKFKSQIKINNKTIYLGMFNTEEEARKAYLEAKQKYHLI